MSCNNPDLRVNVFLVGESGVGKTRLIHHYLYNKCLPDNETRCTMGAPVTSKNIEFMNKKINVRLWDLAGTERYHAVLPTLFRDVHGVIMVYDVGTRSSFDKLDYWLREIQTHCENNVAKTLVANKTDEIHRCISKEEGKERAKALGVSYMEASAKDGDNVEAVFEHILFKVLQNPNIQSRSNNDTVVLKEAVEEDTRPWYKKYC